MKQNKWFKLDNVAKIFPSTSSKKETKVFRCACELYDYIDESILKEALTQTVEMFPSFQVVLKKGLFWYYLETTDIKPVIKEEAIPPCNIIYNSNYKDLLYRVSYYKKRINIEIFHALTDGTGALEFFKNLVHCYLVIRYKKDFLLLPKLEDNINDSEKVSDSFEKYYSPCKNVKTVKSDKAYQIKGEKITGIKIIEGYLSVNEVLKIAHEYNASMTSFLTAILMMAIKEEMSLVEQKDPVVITIPVNLRKYFLSYTLRNFFNISKVGYHFNNQLDTLEDVIKSVSESLKKELEPENIYNKMNKYISLEHNFLARLVPLSIKDFTLKLITFFARKEDTIALSNLGKIEMDPLLEKYIKRFDVFSTTTKIHICICSYMDNLTISFTSIFSSTNIIRNFFRILTSLGIDVSISDNKIDE